MPSTGDEHARGNEHEDSMAQEQRGQAGTHICQTERSPGSLKLHRTYPDGRETWVLSSDTMRRYGELYGIGSQALSTWKRRLSGTIRYRLAREGMASGMSIAKAEQ